MTDLENREAFERAFRKRLGAHICQFDIDEDGNYEDRETLCAWHMWQASAQRQGFKLAPLEPSKEMLKSADNCGIDGKVTANIIYKAMINAV